MTDIFLSYKREDRARATLIVAALRKSGRTVWWDEGLTPRQAWDATIEQEIAAAASVIVLWSPRSVASDWVRSEAHYAQNHSKLVPVLIEPCTVPLAFMLKQYVDLSHWRGSPNDQAWCKLIEWLETQGPATESPRLRDRRARLPDRLGPRTLIVAAFAIGALLAGLFVYRSKVDHAGAPSIRVARFDTQPGDQAAASFSQGFAADLAQIVTSGGSKLRVLDGTAAGAPATNASEFTLNGSVRSEARNLHATLTLNSVADGAIIWSTSLTRPAAETDAMHHEAEVRMGAVFVCALDETARDRSIVSLDALKVYLQACEALPSGDDLHTRKLLRDVTALAPDFAQGWGTLAEWNGFVVGESDDDAPAARKEALDAAARALAIDPRNSAAWVARGMTKTQIGEWSAAQADLVQALTLSPDDPIGNYFYASNLLNVGHTSEALDYAIRAANSGPQFWPKTLQVIATLADLDRVDEAQAMLATALKTWPGNDYLKNFAVNLAARYADPVKAATLDDPALTTGQSPARLHLLRLESDARAHSSQATVEAAAGAIKAFYVGPDNAFGAACNFMVIGRIDDAYASIGEMRTHLRNAPYVDNPSCFFRPFAAKFRADPRFMALAAKLGLVAIWRATKWPDFCTARDTPYDCRAVTEKLAHQDDQTSPRA